MSRMEALALAFNSIKPRQADCGIGAQIENNQRAFNRLIDGEMQAERISPKLQSWPMSLRSPAIDQTSV